MLLCLAYKVDINLVARCLLCNGVNKASRTQHKNVVLTNACWCVDFLALADFYFVFVASAMAHAEANAAWQRLDKALHQRVLEFKSDSHIDRFQHQLVVAVEVYAAAQQALPFSNCDHRIKNSLDYLTKAATRRVEQAMFLNKDLVAEMVRKADADHIAAAAAAEMVRKADAEHAAATATPADATRYVKANAALQRLNKALHQSTLEFKSGSHMERFQHKLENAVEVYAAVQQALPFSNCDHRIKYNLDHPWAQAALRRVEQAKFLNKDLVAEMVRTADTKHAAANTVKAEAEVEDD